MPSYHLFTCPGCENSFRVLWPDPLPSHFHLCSRVKLTCPTCREQFEPYAFLFYRILQAPEAGIPTIQTESISPRDPNPDPDARLKWQQQIFIRRAARFKAMYGN